MENNRNKGWIDYLRLCWQGKWIIFICFIVGMSHGLYQLITAPRFYETELTLLILDSGGGGISIPGVPSFLQLNANSEYEGTIHNVLQSRRMGEMIAERFEFEKRYGIDRSSAIKRAMGMLYPVVLRKFVILRVTAEEKQLAIDVANFCVESLEQFNNELDINSNRSWVSILDRPELFVQLSNKNREKRQLLIESLLGLIVGFSIVLVKAGFRKAIGEILTPP